MSNKQSANITPLEKEEQETFFEYASHLYSFFPSLKFLLFATQSGAWYHGSKSQRIGQHRAATKQGKKKGVADILCLIPMGAYHGLAIEMKRKTGGVVSQDQKDWLSAAEDAGYYAVVANGAGEAIDALDFYLGI